MIDTYETRMTTNRRIKHAQPLDHESIGKSAATICYLYELTFTMCLSRLEALTATRLVANISIFLPK